MPHEAPLYPDDAPSDARATGEVRSLEDVEAELIRFAVGHYQGQMSEVGRRLQISRSTLYRKLEVLGVAAARGAAGDVPTQTVPVAAMRQPRKIA